MMTELTTTPRGFATMTKERQREIATKGGKAVRAETRSFSTDRELAKRAGGKGGKAVRAETRSYSADRELAKRAGRLGGLASQRNRAELKGTA